MSNKNKDFEENENPFALSTGDLMSSLLLVFVLLLLATMLQVQKKADSDDEITKRYNKVKTQLYIDLKEEFKGDLKIWNAMIDSTDLSVRFQEPSTLFDYNKSDLKPKFIAILNDFFPRYIKVITQKAYKNNIEEIRIEGHTDSSGGYFSNMELSQDRTRSVLEYCLFYTKINNKDMEWSQFKITANGLSSSHPILDKNGKEMPELSRRVEFRIRTNAEKQLEEIARKRGHQQ